MSNTTELSELITSYFQDNNTNPRKLAKEIDKVVGISNTISYNTLYYWSKGRTSKPYTADLVLPLLFERANGPLKELAGEVMNVLDIREPVQG